MERVQYLAPDTDAYVESVIRHRDEFESRSGIHLDIQIIPSDEYFSNQIQDYLTADDPPDVFMSGPVLLWEHIGSDLVEPLDRHVERAGDSFDLDDFFAPLIASNRWTGRFRDRLGSGELWEMPVNCESYNLAYVPAVLEHYHFDVPKTWDEYFRTAATITRESGGAIRGFAQRGIRVWHTMYTGYATQFWSYGARDFDDSGRCVIASREGVAATEAFIAALREAGPADWLEQRWYELAMDFAAERYGLIVDSDHYVAFFEDSANSRIAGRVGYAQPPAGPDGRREPNLWTWSLAMNARSRRKDNALRFIEWAAGREFLTRSAFEGNMNPTRRSTWEDATFQDLAAGWGAYYDIARTLVEHHARVLVTPTPHYLKLADRWVRALRSAYAGDSSVAEALGEAARDIEAIVAGT